MKESIIEILAILGAAVILFIVWAIISSIIEEIKDRLKRRCPKCKRVYKFGDWYCRNCGTYLHSFKNEVQDE